MKSLTQPQSLLVISGIAGLLLVSIIAFRSEPVAPKEKDDSIVADYSLAAPEGNQSAIGHRAVQPNLNQAIAFDATLTVRSEFAATRLTLFAKYIVSADSMAMGVVWCEPTWLDPNFPVYPVALNMQFDSEGFAASQKLQRVEWNVRRPFENEGSLKYEFNDYPFGEIRHALAQFDSDATRLGDVGGVTFVDRDRAGNVLMKQTAVISPDGTQSGLTGTIHPGYVRFPVGDFLELTVNGRPMKIDHFNGHFPSSARRIRATFGQFSGLTVPQTIEIAGSFDDRAGTVREKEIRSATFSAFQSVPLSDLDESVAALRASVEYDQVEAEWRSLMIDRWTMPPDDLDASVRKDLVRIDKALEERFDRSKGNGSRLKSTHMRTILSLILGHQSDVTRRFTVHTNLLAEVSSTDVLFQSGMDFFDLAIRWEQHEAAANAADMWAVKVYEVCQPAETYRLCDEAIDCQLVVPAVFPLLLAPQNQNQNQLSRRLELLEACEQTIDHWKVSDAPNEYPIVARQLEFINRTGLAQELRQEIRHLRTH